ncbi:hypothetical protein HK104_008441 [Borealophlyctis nickersoniae]|nr:hypothetical protein HK104_008441 [Borealophlyctis nickersoniae]
MLYDFLQTPRPDKLHASYYLQGEPIKGEGLIVDVVAEEDLEEAKRQFKRYSIHVYSVEPCRPKDSNAHFMVDFAVAKNDTFEKLKYCPNASILCSLDCCLLHSSKEIGRTYRIVQNPAVKWIPKGQRGRSVEGVSSSERAKAPAKPAASAKPDEKEEVDQISKESAGTPKKQTSVGGPSKSKGKSDSKADVAAKRKASFFDGHAKKPPVASKTTDEPKQREPVESPKQPPKKANTAKRTGVPIGRSQTASDRAKSAKQEAELASLFDDDDGIELSDRVSNEDLDIPDGDGNDSEEEMKRMRHLAQAAATNGDGDDDEEKDEVEKQSESPKEAEPIEINDDGANGNGNDPMEVDEGGGQMETRRVRKRRRVKKTRHVMKGKYMREYSVFGGIQDLRKKRRLNFVQLPLWPETEDYTDWESFSEDEPIRQPPPKKQKVAAAPQPPASGRTGDDAPAPKGRAQKPGAAVGGGAGTKGGGAGGGAATKKGGKGGKGQAQGQKSLLSFFGKKP